MLAIPLAESITPHLGQYLIAPSAFLGWFTFSGIASVILMLLFLSKICAQGSRMLPPDAPPSVFPVAISTAAVVSIGTTIVLYILAITALAAVTHFTNYRIIPTRLQSARLGEPPEVDKDRASTPGYVINNAGRTLSRSRPGKVALAFGTLLLVIGAGYVFTTLELPFWDELFATAAGVGLPEEFAKALTGLLILYWLFNTKSMPRTLFKRVVLTAFGLAGLGFGAGEALKYFGDYSEVSCDFSVYIIRATFCVGLHGAWTLIAGSLLADYLPQDVEALAADAPPILGVTICAVVPSALMHGMYNVACSRGTGLCFATGTGALVIATGLCVASLEGDKPDAKAANA